MISPAQRFAERLAYGVPIAEPVVLVVAHPDDETLWAGAAFARLAKLRVIHLTDGAPRDMGDARRLGFATRQAYAEARADELDRAFAALGGDPDRTGYGLVDQEAGDDMAALIGRIAADIAGSAAVITHPYEGGHPDHDSAAFAVAAAVDRIAAAGGEAPAHLEFACYHLHQGARRFGAFWPDSQAPEQSRPLLAGDRARIAKALAAHASQAAVIDGWVPEAERWRAAPAYDFAAPPPPGAALYDGFGWAITSAGWRERARGAMAPA